MRELRGIDLKRASLVPSSVFTSPLAVVKDPGLSLPQKLAILRRWEFDARRVAGLGGLAMLREVHQALQQLSLAPARVALRAADGADPAPARRGEALAPPPAPLAGEASRKLPA
jgi:hypothetical protein